MDTKQLKKFATEARTILKRGVANQLSILGFNGEGQVNDADRPQLVENGTIFQGQLKAGESFYHKWMALYHRIERKGVQEVYEEAAYTWFNRLMAIRILEKNGLIAPVLTFDNDGSRIPQIVANARHGNYQGLNAAQQEELRRLLDDDMRVEEQFQLLLTAYCETNPILKACFGGITEYTELLLPNNITAANGFLDLINHTDFIQDADYRESELIGWLYQFYISEKKDDVFASFKAGHKAKAEDIPAATQIFTPNWIVRYMVENTLGRIYLDNHPGSSLEQDMVYLVKPTEPTPAEAKFAYTTLSELTCADLSCGSGHILNEFFNLLLKMYMAEGWMPQQAIEEIFAHNIVGVDLDTRAKQLTTFSLLLKACQHDPCFFDAHCMPNVLDMPEPWLDKPELGRALDEYFRGEETSAKRKQLLAAFELLEQADNLGSIMQFDLEESTLYMIRQATTYWLKQDARPKLVERLLPSMKLILALTQRYAAICMNPPYMGSGNMNRALSEYVQYHYPEGKADLFAVFMIMAVDMLLDNGKYGMINMQSWMFLSSFERLRRTLLSNYHVDSMLHLGPRTFDELSGEVVQNVAYVITQNDTSGSGIYYRLIDGKDCADKERMFLSAHKLPHVIYSNVTQNNFNDIPGVRIGYWSANELITAFRDCDNIGENFDVKSGLSTGDNDRFLKSWYEVNNRKIFLKYSARKIDRMNYKWIPYSKGGGIQKWYGNNTLVVNWENEAKEMRELGLAVFRNEPYYFKSGITWSGMSTLFVSYRHIPDGFIFDSNKGPMIFPKNENHSLNYCLGFLNTKISNIITGILNPTASTQIGDVIEIPLKECSAKEGLISTIAETNISISREDWDAHETSWDFEANPIVALRNRFLAEGDPKSSFELPLLINEFKRRWEDRFAQLHANEEELNRQFIDIYGLQDELTPEVPLEDITILQQGEISIESNQLVWHDDVLVKQLISYAVGVMMGRYRLDKPGLHIAHPNPTDEELAPYTFQGKQVEIDDDAIIPILPEDAPFPDNASKRMAKFLSIVFGEDTQIDNTNYIKQALGETIETYLQKHFYADHKKRYQNKPIYWLFSSKKGAFQCLAYMHRMNKFTADQVRTKYLLPHIDFLETKIMALEQSFSELTTAERKRLDRYRKDLEECQEYHDLLHDVANRMIEFDLDDGVEKNYELFGSVLAKRK